MASGSVRIAYEVEDSFRTLPGTPVWTQPGENLEVGSLQLNNQLTRARQPDDPRPDGSREGNIEGTFDLSFSLTDTGFHDLVFPASDPVGLATEGQLAPTATWFVEKTTPSETQQAFLEGTRVNNLSMTYTQNEEFQVTLNMAYADVLDASDVDAPSAPSSINQPSKSEIVNFNGVDLDVDGLNIDELQSMSIDIGGMSRWRRGQQRTPTQAEIGAYEPSLSFEALLDDSDQRELAYGSSGATTTEEQIDETAATVTLDNPAGNLVTYNITRAQVNTYELANLLGTDSSTAEAVDRQFRDITVA